jgi:acyl-coenzyme A thioesterase PaaI-like protein
LGFLGASVEARRRRPARGERFLARGRVLRAGRKLLVREIELAAFESGRATPCLYGTQTVACVRNAAEVDDDAR